MLYYLQCFYLIIQIILIDRQTGILTSVFQFLRRYAFSMTVTVADVDHTVVIGAEFGRTNIYVEVISVPLTEQEGTAILTILFKAVI